MYHALLQRWQGFFIIVLSCLVSACGGSSNASGGSNAPLIAAPSIKISASTSNTVAGQPVTLTWSSMQAESCTATGPWNGIQSLNGQQTLTPSISGSFDYTLSCTGAGGSTSAHATVMVTPLDNGVSPPSPPSVSITLPSSNLVLGQPTTLTWSSANATTCMASGSWNGLEGIHGSQVITPSALGSWVYALNCSGPGGSVTRTVGLTVTATSNPGTSPVVALSLSPSTIVAGQSASLSWTANNVSSCTASGDWSGNEALNGSMTLAPTSAGYHTYNLNCTGSAGNASNSAMLSVMDAYALGGTITGLSGTGIVLGDNVGDVIPVTANGSFSFPVMLSAGAPYTISVITQPPGLTCGVAGGSGIMGSGNLSNVIVSCSKATYSVGGNIDGLTASGLVLQDNAGDDLTVSAGTHTYTFATAVASAAPYAVTIKTQPAHQVCVVSSGSGTISSAQISNANISCSATYVYISNFGAGTLSQFIVTSTGQLLPMATATVTTGMNPAALTLDRGGNYAYVVNKGSANLSQYSIDTAGNLTSQSSATVSTGNYPDSVVSDTSGKFVYVSNKGDGTLSLFGIGPSGALSPLTPATLFTGSTPYQLALTPDGKYAYLSNLQGNVSQYSLSHTGNLNALINAQVSAGPNPLGITTDPSSQHVYVTDSGTCQTCANGHVFQFDMGAGGNLTALPTASIKAGSWPIAISLDASGKYAYVVNYGDNTVSQYTVGSDGSLSPMSTATVKTGTNPISLVLTPNGQFAYVVNYGSNNISEYSLSSRGGLVPLSPATVTVGTNPSAMVIGTIR